MLGHVNEKELTLRPGSQPRQSCDHLLQTPPSPLVCLPSHRPTILCPAETGPPCQSPIRDLGSCHHARLGEREPPGIRIVLGDRERGNGELPRVRQREGKLELL